MVDLSATAGTLGIDLGGGEGSVSFLLTAAYTASRISVSPYKKSRGSYSSYTLLPQSLDAAAFSVSYID